MSSRFLKSTVVRLAATLLVAGCVAAQELYVYSEFRRVDPFGEVIPQDRGGRPVEILSPLVARNSHFTFRVVVETPPGQHFYLYIGSNPEDVFDIKVYKEMWTKEGDTWIPDRLLPVESPYLSHLPDRYHGLPNQKVESFLMDVYVSPKVAPKRYKLEPQLSIGGDWIIYPMEVRVSDVVAPPNVFTEARLPSLRRPSDAALIGPLRAHYCGDAETGRQGALSLRRLIRRNALEDLAIVRDKEESDGREEVGNRLFRGLNIDIPTFCAAEDLKGPLGPEWYLRGRNYLYRGDLNWY